MRTPIAPGAWDDTYRKAYLRDISDHATVEITTAITDHLVLVSDIQMTVRTPCGRARAYAEVRLSAQEMRELADLLQITADRVDELEQRRRQMIDGEFMVVETN